MSKAGYYASSAISFIVTGTLIWIGFYTMFHYGTYDPNTPDIGDPTGHVVGGDAYNYIIIAVRGVGYIVASLVPAILGTALLVVGLLSKDKPVNESRTPTETPAIDLSSAN